MKKIIYILLCCFLISCSSKEDNIYELYTSNFTINISLEKNHQFLREYKRFLKIISKDGTKLSSIDLQQDVGTGASSYLYDNSNNYILVDCNGNWYSINKKSGHIILLGNYWQKKIPYHYLGTFLLERNSNKIIFKKQKNITLQDIYIYGGG